MTIGLLNCDHLPESLYKTYGDFPQMFNNFFPDLNFKVYHVCDNKFPESVDECDGWMVTGSKRSVYEYQDWINALNLFVQDIYWSGKHYIGVCFGHQMLAHAMGGKVKKATNGFTVGVEPMTFLEQEPWDTFGKKTVHLNMVCQDEVIEVPENSIVLASTPTRKNAMFKLGLHMIGIQAHPEFSADFMKALLESKKGKINDAVLEKGLATMDQANDNETMKQWFAAFLKHKNV